VPSLVLSAAAPITYAFVIDRVGESGALYLSIGLASLALAAALALKGMFPPAAEDAVARSVSRH
jgi:hypothetical protein